jgi:hypothetical protein
MTAKHIKTWLASQTSYDYRPQADTIQVMEDPQVRDTWAVQFTDADGETVQLMFVCGYEQGMPDEVLENCLEEVEYETWPPQSGSLRFF